jgi:hypothetical protein
MPIVRNKANPALERCGGKYCEKKELREVGRAEGLDKTKPIKANCRSKSNGRGSPRLPMAVAEPIVRNEANSHLLGWTLGGGGGKCGYLGKWRRFLLYSAAGKW